MTRGELAHRTQVHGETLRYYERLGLIPEPPRTESGYRQYSDEMVLRIKFIKRCQELGFSLREVEELLALRVDSDTTCDDVRELAEAKLGDTEAKMAELRRIRGALKKMVAMCNEAGPKGDCPILDALEQPVEGGEQAI